MNSNLPLRMMWQVVVLQDDAHLRPDRLMAEWKRILLSTMLMFEKEQEVFKFKRKGINAIGVLTRDGIIEADKFVLAVGAISPRWKRKSEPTFQSSRAKDIPSRFQDHNIRRAFQ